MLIVDVPAIEYFDEVTGEFGQIKPISLRMEHSLVSMSKWEARWRKPFMTKEPKTYEELVDYFDCMTLTSGVDPRVYRALGNATVDAICKYIDADLSATTIRDQGRGSTRQIITTEQIYWFMFAYGIPIDCQKWHVSRLMKLLRIAGEYNKPQKKMSRKEIMARNHALNEARKKKLGTRG